MKREEIMDLIRGLAKSTGWYSRLYESIMEMDKDSRERFFESVRYWTGRRSPILTAKEDVGISYAWLHHKGRNKHHYEYWIDRVDGKLVYHKVPFEYVIEMVCDWLAACRTYTGDNKDVFKREYDWWRGHSDNVELHKDTKKLVSILLWNLAEHESYPGHNEKTAMEEVAIMLPGWKTIYEDPDIDYPAHYEDVY